MSRYHRAPILCSRDGETRRISQAILRRLVHSNLRWSGRGDLNPWPLLWRVWWVFGGSCCFAPFWFRPSIDRTDGTIASGRSRTLHQRTQRCASDGAEQGMRHYIIEFFK